jgi:hypothetical protein
MIARAVHLDRLPWLSAGPIFATLTLCMGERSRIFMHSNTSANDPNRTARDRVQATFSKARKLSRLS